MSTSEYRPKSGNKSIFEKYYHDPGEVNVHQFYPILEFTFGKQLAIIEKEPFHATAEKNSETEHIFYNSKETETAESKQANDTDAEKKEEDEMINDMKEKCEVVGDSHTESEGAENDAGSKRIQPVFPTAVTEESIEAAKQRIQNMFPPNDWRSGGHQRMSESKRIVTQKANEYFQAAVNMKENQDLVAAITCLTKAINLIPGEPRFYIERGEAYLCICDFQSAILNYKKACLLTDNSPTCYARLAFLYHFQGQIFFDQRLFSEALKSFSKASEMVPENVGYQMRSIVCLEALQRYDECLEFVDKRLQKDRNNPDLFIVRARLNGIFANTSQSYHDVKDALALDPCHPEGLTMMEEIVKTANSHKLLAMQLSILGKDKEAMQKMTLAIQTNPSVADYHVFRGALQRQLKDFNAAVDDFLLALEKCGHNQLEPVYKNSQRQLLLTFNDFAVECFNKGRFQEAITLLSKALSEEKNEKSLYVNRGDCFFKEGELTFALEDYQQALELDLQDQDIKTRVALIYNEFGVDLFENKDYTGAEAKFTQALEYGSHVGLLYIARSRARYMLENLTGAREDILQGLLLSPNNEGIMSICSRLFPGKSIADVINSPAASDARKKLNLLLPTNYFDKHVQSNHSDSTNTDDLRGNKEQIAGHGDDSTIVQSETSWQPSQSSLGFVMSVEDREFYAKQVQDKREVEYKVKDALLNRRSLRYDGPNILPLPSISQMPNQTFQAQRQSLAVAGENTSLKQNKTSWRDFGQIIGGIKNVT